MGDRANVFIKESGATNGTGVYLYTHWNGTELPETLQAALKRRLRWNDDAYLARIIFCEMVKGAERDETGFGISASGIDYNHEDLIVDTEAQTVTFGQHTLSFEDYVALDNPQAWAGR